MKVKAGGFVEGENLSQCNAESGAEIIQAVIPPARLFAEEAEAVIAPKILSNHNETFLD